MKPTTQTTEPTAPKGIYAKLHAAKQLIGKVQKNATNPHFKKSYADINALLETVEPLLWENGLVLLQPIKDDVVTTQIIDIDSGEMIESFMRLPLITDPQKIFPRLLISEGEHYNRFYLCKPLMMMATPQAQLQKQSHQLTMKDLRKH